MPAVMIGPPEGTTLHGGSTPKGEKKLRPTAGLEGAMRKITVQEAGDGKHADEIKKNRRADRKPTPAGPKDPQAAYMQKNERQTASPVDLLLGHFLCCQGDGLIVGVEPTDNGGEKGSNHTGRSCV